MFARALKTRAPLYQLVVKTRASPATVAHDVPRRSGVIITPVYTLPKLRVFAQAVLRHRQ